MVNSVKEMLMKRREEFAQKKVSWNRAYKWKSGKNRIRILPAPVEGEDFSVKFGQNWIKDPSGENAVPVNDRKLCYEEAQDPIRSAMMEAYNFADEHYRKILKEGFGRQEYLVNALILEDKEVDPNTPTIVKFSEHQFDEIAAILCEVIEEEGSDLDPLSLEDGYDLLVERSGTSMTDTRYRFSLARKKSSVDKKVMEKLIDLPMYVASGFEKSSDALNLLSTSVGRAVGDHTAIAGAAGSAANILTGPSAGPAETHASHVIDADIVDVEDSSLAEELDDEIPHQGETSDGTQKEKDIETEASSTSDIDDVLADLDGM